MGLIHRGHQLLQTEPLALGEAFEWIEPVRHRTIVGDRSGSAWC